MHCFVIHVRRNCLDLGGCISERIAICLLFVENKVFQASNDTTLVMSLDRVGGEQTRQIRVMGETFPVAPTAGNTTEGPNNYEYLC